MKKFIHSVNSRRLLIVAALVCLGLLPEVRAVAPPPDGGYPGGNTAEGASALLGLNTSIAIYNTAVGWFSLRTDVQSSYNTAVGAAALFATTSDSNTAVGAGALLLDTTGGANTATGAFALLHNDNSHYNTANGYQALMSHTTGGQNTAIGARSLASNTFGIDNTAEGFEALFSLTTGHGNTASGADALYSNATGSGNTVFGGAGLVMHTDGDFNTAVGSNVLENSVTGSGNIAMGNHAGSGITDASNVICIGTAGGNVSNTCYIGQIAGAELGRDNAMPVYIDMTTGQLGTVLVNAPGHKTTGSVPRDGERQALLNEFLKEHRKMKEQGATIAKLSQEVASLAATVKAQAAQIQRVSARVEVCKPAPRVASSNR